VVRDGNQAPAGRALAAGRSPTQGSKETLMSPGKKYASIKNPRRYEALRGEGMSKERAAKISNAQAAKKRHGKRGRRKK